MATTNALNITGTGLVEYDGAGTFSVGTGGGAYPQPYINSSLTNYLPGYGMGGTGSTSVTDNRLYLTPLIVPQDITITSLATNIATGAAGADGRMGIYSSTNGIPATLLIDAGSTFDASTTGVKDMSISQAISANTLYWGAIVIEENGGNVSALVGSYQHCPIVISTTAAVMGYIKNSISTASTLPSTLSGLTTQASGLPILLYGID